MEIKATQDKTMKEDQKEEKERKGGKKEVREGGKREGEREEKGREGRRKEAQKEKENKPKHEQLQKTLIHTIYVIKRKKSRYVAKKKGKKFLNLLKISHRSNKFNKSQAQET